MVIVVQVVVKHFNLMSIVDMEFAKNRVLMDFGVNAITDIVVKVVL
jgi:hypothetical protein